MLREGGQRLCAVLLVLLHVAQDGLHACLRHLLEAQQHQVIDANASGTDRPHVIASIRIVLVAIPRRIRSGGGEDDSIHLDEEINDFCDLSQHLSTCDRHRRALRLLCGRLVLRVRHIAWPLFSRFSLDAYDVIGKLLTVIL